VRTTLYYPRRNALDGSFNQIRFDEMSAAARSFTSGMIMADIGHLSGWRVSRPSELSVEAATPDVTPANREDLPQVCALRHKFLKIPSNGSQFVRSGNQTRALHTKG
jgi:hypothetical protein